MDIFKLRQGREPPLQLTAEKFHDATGKKWPWYQNNNGPRHYAVCPECDNPLHIINLDSDRKVDAAGRAMPLYARHASTSVAGIADYDAAEYEACTLANPKSFGGKSKTRPSASAQAIIAHLVEFADLVQWQAERFLGLRLSDSEFSKILEAFRQQQGQFYREVSTSNLPYALLYMAGNQRLFQPRVTPDSPFRSAVETSENFRVVDGVVRRVTGVKATLGFYVTAHRIEKAGQGHTQKMTLVIEETIHQPGAPEPERHVLLRQERELEISYFCRSVGKRIRLRQLAEAVFAPGAERAPE
ncbi:hypothetical protein [Tahibacter harae]|uniref:Uncharacterized protein n=1 Tax=Tahibacter harae TaxID=2963937 RepID=A0ABT1QTB6_9GAMM|nr:hypothetical protein [Tahibacter harae]MCQ4165528.1 hypothetical protein [Tahibacter harae]